MSQLLTDCLCRAHIVGQPEHSGYALISTPFHQIRPAETGIGTQQNARSRPALADLGGDPDDLFQHPCRSFDISRPELRCPRRSRTGRLRTSSRWGGCARQSPLYLIPWEACRRIDPGIFGNCSREPDRDQLPGGRQSQAGRGRSVESRAMHHCAFISQEQSVTSKPESRSGISFRIPTFHKAHPTGANSDHIWLLLQGTETAQGRS